MRGIVAAARICSARKISTDAKTRRAACQRPEVGRRGSVTAPRRGRGPRPSVIVVTVVVAAAVPRPRRRRVVAAVAAVRPSSSRRRRRRVAPRTSASSHRSRPRRAASSKPSSSVPRPRPRPCRAVVARRTPLDVAGAGRRGARRARPVPTRGGAPRRTRRPRRPPRRPALRLHADGPLDDLRADLGRRARRRGGVGAAGSAPRRAGAQRDAVEDAERERACRRWRCWCGCSDHGGQGLRRRRRQAPRKRRTSLGKACAGTRAARRYLRTPMADRAS